MGDLKFGLNIGTYNIGISSISAKEILVEKNVIAVRDEKLVIGYGDNAYEMFEKTPENVEIIFPVENSVISDIDKMQAVLEGLYKKLNKGKMIRGTEFLVAVPSDTTEVEKRSFHELVANSKIRPRNISIVEKSIADSIACAIDHRSPRGNLIVNMGADTTEISVISLGGIVLHKTVRLGGNKLNEMIVNAIRHKDGKLIGMKSAEILKCSLVDLSAKPQYGETSIFGRVMATGLPSRTVINSHTVTDAIIDPLLLIIDEVKRVLERTPPELAADIKDNGVFLLGGSSMLKNFDRLFAHKTGLRVNRINDPANSTIRGVTRIFSNSLYDGLRYYPEEKVYN
ncbi:MAG: rod shape-determining protein [Lachnospiraceae bacterium]|jgi:rod shape-determining protein MreB